MLYGINAHQASRQTLELAASLKAPGVPFYVRCDVNMYDVWPERERFNWGWLDDFIRHATELELQVYPTISYAPTWIGPRNTPVPVVYWKLLIREFGTRYQGKVQHIGFLNEPNIPGMYAGSVQRYVADVLQPAAEVLRSIPGADYKICGPDLSTQGTWRPWLQTLLEDGRPWLDMLTVHAYGTPGRKVRDRLLDVRQVMDWAHAMDVPIALTEWGWNTSKISEAQQANYCDQFLEAAQSISWLSAALWFNLINESESVQWGAFRSDGTEKPVAAVLRRYAGRGEV